MRSPLLVSCCFVLLLLCLLLATGKGDDSPGFFLKITKNVPRLGRRTDKEWDSYFLKNAKIIPRMGRRADELNGASDILAWFEENRSPDKRMLLSSGAAAAAAEREYSVVQPVNVNTLIELLEKDAIPSENIKFVHWKDFDRALQLDADLYGKVISLGRRPDQRLREDLRYSNQLGVYNGGGFDVGGGGNGYMYYSKDENPLYPTKLNRDYGQFNHLK